MGITSVTLVVMALVLGTVGTFAQGLLAQSGAAVRLVRACQLIVLIAGTYCVIAGIAMVDGWSDSVAGTEAQGLGASAARSRRGGVIVFVYRLWPFVMIGIGALWLFTSVLGLRLPVGCRTSAAK
jgi:hypothetical protein